jgi:hypothetical protein
MTPLDSLIQELASQIEPLSQRAQVAFYLVCAQALLPEYKAWTAKQKQSHQDLFRQAQTYAENFIATGEVAPDTAELLRQIERTTPTESPAQDCWICIDLTLRIQVSTGKDIHVGNCIEYALTPSISAATEKLFGVSQLGSEDEESYGVVLQQPTVQSAITFCQDAARFLAKHPQPTSQDLSELYVKAAALA